MSRTTEDYLKTIYLIRQKQGYVRSVALAEAFGVSKPTVCYTVKKLIEEGYVTKNNEHFLFLTPKGTAVAEATLKRNRTICELLVCLGVDKKTAETDACKMEHIISPESLEALKSFVESPCSKQCLKKREKSAC